MSEPAAPAPASLTCYRHPERETGVRCQRCGRPVCAECLVQAPVGVQCLDCVRAVRRHSRPALAMTAPLATYSLVGVNVLVWLAGAVLAPGRGGLLGVSRLAAEYGLAAVPVAAGEWWRLLTSGFIHANVTHIAFNMLALFMVGPALEQVLGRGRFLLLYLAALLAGSLGALLLSPGALTIGASGAIFGLFGALLVAQRMAGVPLRASGILPILVINLVFTLATPGVSIGAHLGGLAGGALAGAVAFNRTLRRAGRQGAVTSALALAVLAAVAGAAAWLVALTRVA